MTQMISVANRLLICFIRLKSMFESAADSYNTSTLRLSSVLLIEHYVYIWYMYIFHTNTVHHARF